MAAHGIDYAGAESPEAYLNSTTTARRSKADTAGFYRQFADDLRRCSVTFRAAGVQLGFHAHSSEYEPLVDGTPLNILTETLSAEELVLEVDVLWTSMAGEDPIRVIAEYGSRCRSLHLSSPFQNTVTYM